MKFKKCTIWLVFIVFTTQAAALPVMFNNNNLLLPQYANGAPRTPVNPVDALNVMRAIDTINRLNTLNAINQMKTMNSNIGGSGMMLQGQSLDGMSNPVNGIANGIGNLAGSAVGTVDGVLNGLLGAFNPPTQTFR